MVLFDMYIDAQNIGEKKLIDEIEANNRLQRELNELNAKVMQAELILMAEEDDQERFYLDFDNDSSGSVDSAGNKMENEPNQNTNPIIKGIKKIQRALEKKLPWSYKKDELSNELFDKLVSNENKMLTLQDLIPMLRKQTDLSSNQL